MEFHIRKNWIDFDIKKDLNIKEQCNLLNISRSCIYHKSKPKIKPIVDLGQEILKVYNDIPFYGHIRAHKELLEKGIICSLKEVRKIREKLGIRTLIPQKQSNYKGNKHKKYPYLLKNLVITHSNQVWVSDITYIKLRQGMIYKVAIMDIFSRKILGYKISNSLNKKFCIDLLQECIDKYGVPKYFNTDQGSQFTSDEFIKVLKSYSINISMDGAGRALDNIFIERYWKSYKYESVFLHNYFNMFDAKLKTRKYVEFYNQKRFHSSLNYKTPDEIYFSNLPKLANTNKDELPLKNMS